MYHPQKNRYQLGNPIVATERAIESAISPLVKCRLRVEYKVCLV